MAGLSSAHLRELADRLDADEAEERRNLEQAETVEERNAIRDRIAALEARNEELEKRLAGAAAPDDEPEDEPDDEPEDEPEDKPKMRRGRKRGQVYQDKPGEAGYVYQGDDEPDLVPVEEPGEAAA